MKQKAEALLNEVGITINGNKPYDIQVHDERFWNKLIYQQSIGVGESYMDGWWDCERLDELFFRVCRNQLHNQFYSKWKNEFLYLKSLMINHQSRSRADEVARTHYNLDHGLYEKMLGKSMAYTCGYWKNAHSLDEAQFDKYDLVCKKLYLKPGEKVLEIGCGRGGLAKYMVEKYGCEVVALDVGEGPIQYAKKLCKNLPVTLFQCDYRDVDIYNPEKIKFDKLVSVGVLEHIGHKNYGTLIDIARSFIKEDGIFLLHSIGANYSRTYCDPWINKYIFPNGVLPSIKQLGSAFEHKFVVEDLQNFGSYYDKTLMSWNDNLNSGWPELKSQYDEKFHRMMNYYLLSCAGSFRARDMQLCQYVLTPHGQLGGYTSVR